MKDKKYIFLTTILSALFIGACSDLDSAEELTIEDRIFENYLLANNITAEPTASGLYYIEELEGTGASPNLNDWVIFNYSLYTLKTGSLVITTNEVLARNVGIYDSRVLYGPSKTAHGYNISGLDEGLSMMKEGGKAKLLFKSDLGYGSSIIGAIDSYSSLLLQVELLRVIEDPVLDETENTIKYLEENQYSTDTTESGIYYVSVVEGSGDKVSSDDLVTIDVKASLLDGRVLSNVKNLKFQIGSFASDGTIGLSEGLKNMKVGGEAKFIVPYNYAFGPFGRTQYSGYSRIPIPPYSTIVYDVSLISL